MNFEKTKQRGKDIAAIGTFLGLFGCGGLVWIAKLENPSFSILPPSQDSQQIDNPTSDPRRTGKYCVLITVKEGAHVRTGPGMNFPSMRLAPKGGIYESIESSPFAEVTPSAEEPAAYPLSSTFDGWRIIFAPQLNIGRPGYVNSSVSRYEPCP